MTYGPIGYYATCDDAYCVECLHEEESPSGEHTFFYWDGAEWEGFESWEEPLTIFPDEEIDTPTHCEHCGDLIQHNLTPDGYVYVAEYVQRSIEEGLRNPVTHMWVDSYSYGLEDLLTEEELNTFFALPLDPHPALRKFALYVS